MTTYFAFAAIVTMIVVSPGPNLFLLLKNTPPLGRRVGLLNTAGIAMAIMCHATLSLIGVSAIVLASAAIFSVIKLVGAVYLIYLGAMALREAWRGAQIANKLDVIAQPAVVPGHRVIAEGWLTGILNPKPSMFYLAVFPQFLDPTGPMFLEGLSLGALHACIALAWYGFIVFTVEQVRSYLRHPAMARSIKAVSGAVLVGFGARLATLRAPA